MSLEDIARVTALYQKADELETKGHLLRAAGNFGRAAEAARALDSGPDSLVAVNMQRCQARVLLDYVLDVDDATADARIIPAYRAEIVSLHSSAVAAMERRRAAGTLLEGKCTAAEEAWRAAHLKASRYSEAEAARWAPLMGYDAFLLAANSILCLFENSFAFAGDCTAAQFQAFTEHIVNAADLMQQPRSHDTTPIPAEVSLAQGLSTSVGDDAGVPYLQRRGLDAAHVQLLSGAWQRLQRSGVLEARGLLAERKRREANASRGNTAVQAADLRTCALAGCGAKEAHAQHFKCCAACQTVVYCSKEHQLEDWSAHKKACKAARKAAVAPTAEVVADPVVPEPEHTADDAEAARRRRYAKNLARRASNPEATDA